MPAQIREPLRYRSVFRQGYTEESWVRIGKILAAYSFCISGSV